MGHIEGLYSLAQLPAFALGPGLINTRQQANEFFSAIARKGIRRSLYGSGQVAGDGFQTGIPAWMAMIVVVFLEGIHIDHDESDRRFVAQPAAPFPLIVAIEKTTIGYAGQWIALGKYLEGLLAALECSHYGTWRGYPWKDLQGIAAAGASTSEDQSAFGGRSSAKKKDRVASLRFAQVGQFPFREAEKTGAEPSGRITGLNPTTPNFFVFLGLKLQVRAIRSVYRPLACALCLLLGACAVLRDERDPAAVFADRQVESPVFQSAIACHHQLTEASTKTPGVKRSLGPRLAVASWNARKSTGKDWQSDLQQLIDDTDILLLQEAALVPATREVLPYRFVAVAEGYVSAAGPTGVLSASHMAPLASCAFIDREPLFRTPKASSITRYPLANREETLLVANVHSVNFSLGLETFQQQLTRLAIVLHQHEGPIIFAGDLNIWNAWRAELVSEMVGDLGLKEVAFALDSRKIVFGYPLDRIYLRGLSLISATTKKLDSSDHDALIAILRTAN